MLESREKMKQNFLKRYKSGKVAKKIKALQELKSKNFDRVITCELNKNFYLHASEKIKKNNIKNILIFNMDSIKFLKRLRKNGDM
jgi:hypothetical protein